VNRHLLPDEIDLLLDGEAGFGVAPLRAHVRQCPECLAELEAARLVVAELEALPHLAPSPLFAERVMQQVQVFEPWHVALLDNARRFVPQSRPARVLAAAGALSVTSVLTVAILWLGARLDILTMLGGTAMERMQAAARGMLGDVIASALGAPAEGLLRSGTGVALLATTFILAIILAAAGLRAVAASSARRNRA
jgi:hypothetical protein